MPSPYLLRLNGEPALLFQLAVTAPRPPLLVSAGIVGLAAGRPDGRGPVLTLQVVRESPGAGAGVPREKHLAGSALVRFNRGYFMADSYKLELTQRPRRLRRTSGLRGMVEETVLRPQDFIAPLFVIDGKGAPEPIGSMPG